MAQADNGSVFTADAGTETDLYVGADVKKLTFTNLPIGNYDAAVVTVKGKTYKSGLRGSDGRTPVDGEITVTDGTELDIAVTKRDGKNRNLETDGAYHCGCGDESDHRPDRQTTGCGQADTERCRYRNFREGSV